MSAVVTFTLFVVIYVAILAAATLLSQPIRVKMQYLGMDILDDDRQLSNQEKDEIGWLIESGTSSAIGLMLPFAAIFLLAATLLGADLKTAPRFPRLSKDPRFAKMVKLYVFSIVMCSPFAFAIASPLIIVLLLAVSVKRDAARLVEAAEAPVMTTSWYFQRA